MNNYDTFTQRLRNAVARSGKSKAAIARESGIKPPHFSQILSEKTGCNDIALKKRMAHATGVSELWLISGEGEPFPKRKVHESVANYGNVPPAEDEAEKARLAEAAEIQKKSDDLLAMFRSMVPMMETEKLMEIGETCKSLPMTEIIIKELRKRIPRDPEK